MSYQPQEHDAYVRKIKKLPLLEDGEEYVLAKKWREHKDAKAIDKLLSSHLRLVVKIASGYRGYGLPVVDLIAEGNLGMLQAVKHYDPEKGFRFSTYAMWWIRANIQEHILQSWSLVKMGTTNAQKKLFFSLKKTQALIEKETGDQGALTPEKIQQIAEKLSVKEDDVKHMYYRLSARDNSLNTPLKEEENAREWIEWIADERENQEVVLIEKNEMAARKKIFDQAFQSLNPRERDIFVSRRLKEPPQTLEIISAHLSISRERVRQIENQAFDKLQKAIKKLIQ